MKSFRKTGKELQLPLGVVWLMNSISEYKGKQELYARQSPQILETLIEMAMAEFQDYLHSWFYTIMDME